ncbi:MAG: hypothetical protein ACOYXM_04800 [Actinomycetota bacterium]
MALVAVGVALAVVGLTRPSDDELRREVVADLGVPEAVLDVPLVDDMVARAGAQAQDSVLDELDASLAMGAAAGVASAVVLAAGVVWLVRRQRS